MAVKSQAFQKKKNLNYTVNKFCTAGYLTSAGLSSLICKVNLTLSESVTLGNLKIRLSGSHPQRTDFTVQPGLKSQFALTLWNKVESSG